MILTRIPVLSFGVRAYVDIPYVALALGAILAEARGRGPRLVLVLLALAGPAADPRPGCSRSPTWRGSATSGCLPLAVAAAPVIWMAHDLVLAGDPLHSLLGTRDNAEVLERTTGLSAVPRHRPAAARRDPARAGAARRGRGRAARAGLHAPARGAADRGRLRLDRRLLRARRRRPADPRPLPAAPRRAAGGVLRSGSRSAGCVLDARPPVADPLGGDRRGRPGGVRRLRARPDRPRSATSARSMGTQADILADLHAITDDVTLPPGRGPEPPPGPPRRALDRHPAGPDRLRAARAADPRHLHRPRDRARPAQLHARPARPEETHGERPARASRRSRRTRRGGCTRVADERKMDRAPNVEVGLRGLSASLTPAGRPRYAHR